MAEIHLITWEILPAAVGYGSVALGTARVSYRRFRSQWMDTFIRKRKAWEAGLKPEDKRRSKGPQDLLDLARDEWVRKGSKEASEGSFYAGLLWPVFWVVSFIGSKSEPSREEKALIDLADYERLKELERQAGLKPLDEVEEGR